MVTKKVLFVVASKGYQSVEFAVPKNLLEQAGYSVTTASNAQGSAIAHDESTTPIDMMLDQVNLSDYDGIFFVGGPGAMENLDNEYSHSLIQQAFKERKLIGAICISTRILAHAGILKDKQATGWNGDNELGAIYQVYRVQYVPKDVVVDGNIITATGPNAAREYAELIISLLQERSGE